MNSSQLISNSPVTIGCLWAHTLRTFQEQGEHVGTEWLEAAHLTELKGWEQLVEHASKHSSFQEHSAQKSKVDLADKSLGLNGVEEINAPLGDNSGGAPQIEQPAPTLTLEVVPQAEEATTVAKHKAMWTAGQQDNLERSIGAVLNLLMMEMQAWMLKFSYPKGAPPVLGNATERMIGSHLVRSIWATLLGLSQDRNCASKQDWLKLSLGSSISTLWAV